MDPMDIDDVEMVAVRSAIFLDVNLYGKFKDHGYDPMTMACRVIPYMANDTTDVEPELHVNTQKGFELKGRLMIDLECTPEDDPEKVNFEHIFTLVSNNFYFAGKVKIEENLLISIKDAQVDLNIDKVEKSNIGEVDVATQKIIIQIFEPFIVLFISSFLDVVKIPLGAMLFDFLGIDWLNLDETILELYENYFILFTSPKFNFPPERVNGNEKSHLSEFLTN